MTRSLYSSTARSIMFLASPESSHDIAKWTFRRLWFWKLVRRRLRVVDDRLQVKLENLTLPNPIGLAAGFDKNCEVFPALFCMGFGFLSLGTVTLNARVGNPKPRIWRYPNSSLVNSMGLPNDGAEQVRVNLTKHSRDRTGPVIVSVSGLSVEEFAECFRKIEPFADGVEVNISTPNTEGVRIFLDPTVLTQLLREIAGLRDRRKPIWVKIPPYYDEKEREHVLELVNICAKWDVNGITAINAKKVPEPRAAIGTGGLTGPLIFDDMLRTVSDVYRQIQGRIPVIACGGISSGMDVWRAFEVGASAVQIYTSFVYKGPGVVRRMNRQLLELLKSSQIETLAQVTGTGLR